VGICKKRKGGGAVAVRQQAIEASSVGICKERKGSGAGSRQAASHRGKLGGDLQEAKGRRRCSRQAASHRGKLGGDWQGAKGRRRCSRQAASHRDKLYCSEIRLDRRKRTNQKGVRNSHTITKTSRASRNLAGRRGGVAPNPVSPGKGESMGKDRKFRFVSVREQLRNSIQEAYPAFGKGLASG
jgi:hypothetical protein